ncbi:hypothetical protein DL96DRAFT_413155 [Flagelloscypha sp. PMI_526]|nr:hypothetical protein DL96DRAFT_413155 [Flagelloscypha sp. PMI_526]
MQESQSKDLRSFFGTLVAHGNPRAHSQLGRSILQPASNLDTGLNAVGVALQLTKDAGDAAKEVPYVKAVAGIIAQIIKIKEEIRANKERCGDIIDLVQMKSTTILQSLDKVYEAKGAQGFEDLKADLEAYSGFLQAVLQNELEPFRKQPRWSSYINREKNAGSLYRLERELEEFNHRFSLKRLVEISVALIPTAPAQARVIPQALPPSPKLVIGREPVVDSVIHVTLSSSEPRVVILGQGGIGKTTIATAVLHDSRIISAYPTIYFVCSELTPTIELLETHIADTLSIPQGGRGTDLLSQIVDRIRQDPHPVLLCIDNLETVWEIEAEQPRVDNFLEILSGMGNKLALVVTMRGTQAPNTSFSWDSTILSGLSRDDSVVMYENLSSKSADASAHELLLQLSGSPLAIKLFSRMVQEGDMPSQLLSSWNEHGTKALEVGGTHRLSSLERSIHLSVFSPRLNDTARLVLGLIALMPDGLSTSGTWFTGFESVLPDEIVLRSTLRALRRTALLDQLGEPSRWQMLPPIRQFCLQLVDSASSSVTSLVELYITTVRAHNDYSSATSLALIPPEMANIRGLLLFGSNLQHCPDFIGKASARYVGWAYWQDIDESSFLSSFLRLPIPSDEQAAIHQTLGMLHCHWNRLGAATESLTRGLELYDECQDRLGKAKAHGSIGNLHMRRCHFDEAKVSFTRALELYTEVPDRVGEANIHRSIGDLHMRRGQLDEAGTSFNCALERYSEVHNRLGEANALKSIGNLHMRRDRLDEAGISFDRALELYGEIQDRLGEANTHRSIGHLYMRRGDLGQAKSYFTRALGRYSEVMDQEGIADCTLRLGQISFHQQELEAAETAISQALGMWESICDDRGIAKTHVAMGELHLKRRHLDEAEASLTRALDIYTTKVKSPHNEALTNRSIGELHILRGQFKDSERVFRRALALDVATGDRLGQAHSYICLGSMFLKQENLEVAESSYVDAFRLFLEIENYQVIYCLLDLGKVWVRQGKIDECYAEDAVLLRALCDVTNPNKELKLLNTSEM